MLMPLTDEALRFIDELTTRWKLQEIYAILTEAESVVRTSGSSEIDKAAMVAAEKLFQAQGHQPEPRH